MVRIHILSLDQNKKQDLRTCVMCICICSRMHTVFLTFVFLSFVCDIHRENRLRALSVLCTTFEHCGSTRVRTHIYLRCPEPDLTHVLAVCQYLSISTSRSKGVCPCPLCARGSLAAGGGGGRGGGGGGVARGSRLALRWQCGGGGGGRRRAGDCCCAV